MIGFSQSLISFSIGQQMVKMKNTHYLLNGSSQRSATTKISKIPHSHLIQS